MAASRKISGSGLGIPAPSEMTHPAVSRSSPRAILKIGEVVDIDKCDDRLAVLTDGERPLSAMRLLDGCASLTPKLGLTYHRLLSGVTHARRHGLTQFLVPVGPADADGSVPQALSTSAGDLARDPLVGPLCAATLVEHLGWYPRGKVDDLRSEDFKILHAWGRIAGVPYPGP